MHRLVQATIAGIGLTLTSFAPSLAADPARIEQLSQLVAADEPRLIDIFKKLHAHPELAFEEVGTAAFVAEEFKQLGYEVHTGIGKTGVVGVLKNGPGPVVMFRGDMDGLPVREQTGLDYASTATSADGRPMMHACGHDAHVVFLLGVAKIMQQQRAHWSGTLILVAQPAEELIQGARAMVDDGLYDRIPAPDYLVASHVLPILPAGTAAVRAGRRMAGTDQIDVTINGVGGHGSMPQSAKDPIVMGSMAVIGYQTIVSRAIDPQEPGVITVGAFQGGDSNNVIPDSVTLKVNLRWFNPQVRSQMIDGIQRITDSIASAAGLPADRMPQYTFKGTAGPVVNDEATVALAEPALRRALGDENVLAGIPPVMGSEDFQDLAHPHPTTRILWIEVGCGPDDVIEQLQQGRFPPMNHNPKFMVSLPTIPAGTLANAAVVLELLQPR